MTGLRIGLEIKSDLGSCADVGILFMGTCALAGRN